MLAAVRATPSGVVMDRTANPEAPAAAVAAGGVEAAAMTMHVIGRPVEPGPGEARPVGKRGAYHDGVARRVMKFDRMDRFGRGHGSRGQSQSRKAGGDDRFHFTFPFCARAVNSGLDLQTIMAALNPP
jgi:hypothetical protein